MRRGEGKGERGGGERTLTWTKWMMNQLNCFATSPIDSGQLTLGTKTKKNTLQGLKCFFLGTKNILVFLNLKYEIYL